MTGARPATRASTTSHLDVTGQEFERRLAAHGHDVEEIHRLWDELANPEGGQPGARRVLDLGPVIAVYLGLLLVVAACGSLLGIYWSDLGAWGVLVVGLVYLTTYLAAGEVLRRRDLREPADVLEAVAVGWVGLVTYAVARLGGIWPTGASNIDHVHIGLTTIAIVGLLSALTLLALRPDPLLFVPLGLALCLLAVDLAELAFGNDLSDRQRILFILPLGLAYIALGLRLDVTHRREYASWAHWVGLAASAGAIITLVPKTVPGFAIVGVLGALALFFSAFVRHWSFTLVGAGGVLMATISGMSLLGKVAPVVIAIVGLALIGVGLRWSKWREGIRRAALARLPAATRDFVTRLAP